MTPVPNPPPRGGAEPRVSDAILADHIAHGDSDYGQELALDLRDARAECADLRAKLETAEAERDEARLASCSAKTEDTLTEAELREFLGIDENDALERSIAVEQGSWEREGELFRFWIDPEVALERADAAEAALREMTEQRDGAWEAALDAAATRLMLWADAQELSVPPEGWSPSALLRQAATSLSALAPPAETAAKEERK